ncbi:hypothetical protein [Clostridium gasigenes]|uniref:hypothetical protein n=1 Tax=Clostridium gasigenes TaxID=94869 RepID=UPI001C0D47D7|nr:hypothetical protein [Clostridium gasigenes]MBU3107164.1 hypothetical protein [Clostridium gasigenes]
MKINEKYKLESDELNVMVMEKYVAKEGKKAGEEQWKAISYHPNMEMALNSLITLVINGTGLKDAQIIVAKIKELREFVVEVSRCK